MNSTNSFHEDENLTHENDNKETSSMAQEEREYLLNGSEPPTIESSSMRFAGFWMRFWAYLLDLIIIGSVNRILLNPIFRALDIDLQDGSMFAPVSIATAITFYAYFVLMTKFLGQTLGKMAFGLKVVDLKGEKLSWGTIIFREWIGRFISTTVWITYVVVAFLPKKQGIHDLFADTTVVHEK